MEALKTILKDGINGISKDNFNSRFKSIAQEIICNFSIKCGDKRYRFVEIEFYYYDSMHLNEEWNRKTYPRTGKATGDLFFHYSGVDICFESDYPKGVFGGILIRSLYDENKRLYITGPLLCANEILNNGCWPIVEKASPRYCKIATTSRYGKQYDEEFDDQLCFYDENIILFNEFKKATWDYKKKQAKDLKRNYTNRFKCK